MTDRRTVFVERALAEAPEWVRIFAADAEATHWVEQRLYNESMRSSRGGVSRAPIVVSDRVLQYLDEASIDRALHAIHEMTGYAVFCIRTRYAAGPMVDGHNEFISVADSRWWRARIMAVFGQAHAIAGTPDEYCVIVTAPITGTLKTRLDELWARRRRHATWARRVQRVRGRLWRMLRPTLDEREITAELAGAHIALVGNAASLAERGHGPAIDAADIVVRCNRGILVSASSHGRRTDWIVTALPMSEDTATRRGIHRIVWASRRTKMMRNIPAWMFRSGRLCVFSKQRDRRLRDRLGKTASTGMKAIDLLVTSACTRLDIYGFDFAETHSASQPTQLTMSPDHDFVAERRYALALIEADPRLHLHR